MLERIGIVGLYAMNSPQKSKNPLMLALTLIAVSLVSF
jgi:hypothetical protein